MRVFVFAILLVAIAWAGVEARGGGGGGRGGFGGHGGFGGGGWGGYGGFGRGYGGWGGYGGYGGYGGLGLWGGYYNNPYYYNSMYLYGKRELASPFMPAPVWRSIPNVAGVAGLCRLFTNESMLSCMGPKSLVECPVVFNSTFFNTTTAFGLGKITTMNYTTTPSDKQQFSIFPRSEDNTKWLNSTLTFNNTMYNLALYTTNATATCGIRVVDPACFANLSSIFTTIEVEDFMIAAIKLF